MRKGTIVIEIYYFGLGLLLAGVCEFVGLHAAYANPPVCSCSKEWVHTFRGNQHRAFYGTGFIPSKLRIRWKFKTRSIRDRRLMGYGGRKLIWRGTGWSGQAAVVGDRVWLSSVGGVLYCLNRHTGRQIWKFHVGGAIKSSVTYWNNRVYFGSRSNYLYCLNASTGKLLWKHHTRSSNVDSTPIVWKGRLYWGSEDSHLYAMDPFNGKIHWKYKTMGSIESSPMVFNNKIYINSYDGYLHCLDLKTGRLIWRFRTGDDTDTTPTFHRGKIYLGSENGLLYAVDAQTGELVWKRRTSGGIWSTPTVSGRRVFVGSNDQRFYAFDADTGRLLWKYKTKDGVWASSVLVGGRLLFGDWSGYIHILRAKDGMRIFRTQIGAKYKKDGNHIVSTASVVKGRVYLGSRDGHFYCFDGPRQWSAARKRRSQRWRQRYGLYNHRVVRHLGTFPPPKVLANAVDLVRLIPSQGQRNRLVKELTSSKLQSRLLIARILRMQSLSQRLGLVLLKYSLQDGADHIRLEAVQAAARYGPKAAAMLRPMLRDRDGRVRAAVCLALGHLKHNKAIAEMVRLTWDQDASVQVACSQGLFMLGARAQARESLRRLLFADQFRWRRKKRRAVRSSKKRRRRFYCPKRVSKYFLYRQKKGLIRRSPREKRPIFYALLTLHRMGDRCGKKHLDSRWYGCRSKKKGASCSVYRDWQGWMRRLSIQKLIPLISPRRKLRTLRYHGLPRYKDNNLRALGVAQLIRLNDAKRMPILLRMMAREKYPMIRILAARGLALSKHRSAHKVLLRALFRDASGDVRLEAARSLSTMYKKKALPWLAKQLKKERLDWVKAGIAVILTKLGHAPAQQALRILLASPALHARCLSFAGLVSSQKGFMLVRQQLNSSERYLRICAINALIQQCKAGNHTPAAQKTLRGFLVGATQHRDPAIALRALFSLVDGKK